MTPNVSEEVHMTEDFELTPAELRCLCDPAQFDFNDTSQIEPLDVVIGQQRAVQAIDFGLGMRSPGYNIFVTGYEGTGKTTIVEDIVQRTAAGLKTACDWCMVNNFKDEFRPRAISLPSGQALKLAKQMENFIEIMKARLPREFEDKPYQNQQAGIRARFEEKKAMLFPLRQSRRTSDSALLWKYRFGATNSRAWRGRYSYDPDIWYFGKCGEGVIADKSGFNQNRELIRVIKKKEEATDEKKLELD
jgi:hypothetical protein